MGSRLSAPVTTKHSQSGSGNGLSYSISSMQGWREEMEDNHCAYIGLPQSIKEWNFFAVFDGHGGKEVSSYSSKNLLDTILKSADFSEMALNNSHMCNENIEIVKSSIRNGYLELDSNMKSISEIVKDKSGSTAVSVLISEKHMYFANCGDSRAVLFRNNEVHFFTTDHKPVNDTERMRIKEAGGRVCDGRVNGNLAVSRCLGDYEFKQNADKDPWEQQISPEPEITVLERNNEFDEFIVLACDGIWDVMTNEEICDNIRYLMQTTTNLEDICNCVLDACLEKGSKDNMSIILITFPGSPKVSLEFIKKDKEINEKIGEHVKDALLKRDLSKILLNIITPKNNKIFESLPLLPSPVFDFKSALLEHICVKLANILSRKDQKNIMEMKESFDLQKNVYYNNNGCGNDLRYGGCILKRETHRIKKMSPTSIDSTSIGLKNWSFFALFDNHITNDFRENWPSSNCVYGADNLLGAIIDNFNLDEFGNPGINENIGKVMRNIRNGFLGLDKKIKIVNEEDLKFQCFRTDWSKGTTVVSVLISPTHFYFANCGNLRSFLVRNGKVCFVTKHHKFLNKSRLVKINDDYIHDVQLKCSRALGVHNFYYREKNGILKSMSSEPKIEVIERDQLDEFLVLLSHNSSMSEVEICDKIRYMMTITSDLEDICSSVSNMCFEKGYKDHVSMIIVAFSGAPKFSLEAKKRDENIKQVIEWRVKNILADSNKEIASGLLEVLNNGKEFICNSLGLLSNAAYFKHKLFLKICKEIASNFTSELKNQEPAVMKNLEIEMFEKPSQKSPQNDCVSKKTEVASDNMESNESGVTIIDFDNYSEEEIVNDSKKVVMLKSDNEKLLEQAF